MRIGELLALKQHGSISTHCDKMSEEVGLEEPKSGRATIAYSDSGR